MNGLMSTSKISSDYPFKRQSHKMVTLKQFVGKLPANCLSVIDHFVKLAQLELDCFLGVFQKELFSEV